VSNLKTNTTQKNKVLQTSGKSMVQIERELWISPTDYGYTGQMREGDIYFYNARWYDPVIGRFMQADTISVLSWYPDHERSLTGWSPLYSSDLSTSLERRVVLQDFRK